MTMKPALFDVDDRGSGADAPALIQPWKRVPLDPAYSGAWIVAGDIDGDDKVEIVSARNVNVGDVHYTSAVAAHDLAGRVLWRWGDPGIGRRGLHHDVACQIHDWDGDGRNEVIVCGDGCIVELDGATGVERRRLPIPPEATDCLVFADLAGRGYAAEVLVKTRYGQIWALDYAGRTLWTIREPVGFQTAHQPVPVDLDGDGRDEVIAGYALLNPDGQVRWTIPDNGRFAGAGHLDCARVLRRGERLADWRLVLTCCGHQRLLAIDGTGRVCWEVTGHHFESIDIGRVCAARPGPQIAVDLVAYGDAPYPVWILDENGELLGQVNAKYSRFHTLLDWNGDGLDKLVLPHARGLFDGQGRRIGTFDMEPQPDPYAGMLQAEGEIGNIVLNGDMDGDGVPDITITAPHEVCVFRNPNCAAGPGAGLGSHPNFTLY